MLRLIYCQCSCIYPVDQAEREPERVRLINAIATGVLAEEAFHLKAGLIHYSTDYVLMDRRVPPMWKAIFRIR
jgi:dTDP-4-dehydrorhamnose reductase